MIDPNYGNYNVQAKTNEDKILLWQLFAVFFQIGCFTFGGGIAMLPLIQKAVVEKKNWVSETDFVNMLAITNSVPGAFAINCAIFIGYQKRGLLGGIAAALGVVLPSFIIILAIAYILLQGKKILWLDDFFTGVRPAVIALILGAGLKMGKKMLKLPFDFMMLVIGLVLMIFTPLHPVFIIIFGSLIGLLYLNRKGALK
ncbi:MAG: chromate transporter [Clostridia bacterium]|jgi:chromate transporter|nr:chromate transporter [Clostridia bacterium]